MCDSLCHAGYSTPPSHTNAKMLGPRTETHEEEGACAHKLHVCSLQPVRGRVGPCCDPQRTRFWCYQFPELRYSCSKVWLRITSEAPGLLGNSMMMTLSSTEQPEQPVTTFSTRPVEPGVLSSDATLQPAQEMSVDEVSEITNVWPEPGFSQEILLLV